MSYKTGGPAFPHAVVWDENRGQFNVAGAYCDVGGLSVLDYFAAAALPAVCTAMSNANCTPSEIHQYAPQRAYNIAEAMLAEKEKRA